MIRPVFVLVDVGDGIDDDALAAQHRLLLDLRDAWALAPATSDTLALAVVERDGGARTTVEPCDPLDPAVVIERPRPGTGRGTAAAFAEVARRPGPPPIVVLLLGGAEGDRPDDLPTTAGVLVCAFGDAAPQAWAPPAAAVLTGPLGVLAPVVIAAVLEAGYTGEAVAVPPGIWLPDGVAAVG